MEMDYKHKPGILERAFNALGNALITLGHKVKSWYSNTDNQTYNPMIHIE